jgi:hypothetical protein
MVLFIQDCFSFRTVKRILLWKAGVDGSWIKFLLNESLFTDSSKFFEILKQINLIKMIVFHIESQLVTFKYSNQEFNLVLDNNKSIDDIEPELKYKAGLGNDVKFYDFGNRQIQKGEYVYEHPMIMLKKINERAETTDCRLVDMDLNAFIGNINVKTTIKCLNGWNRVGLLSILVKFLDLITTFFIFAQMVN